MLACGFEAFSPRCSILRRAQSLVSLAAGLSLMLGLGCERDADKSSAGSQPQITQAADVVEEPERPLPTYRFAPELRQRYPQVAAFVQDVLETCLADDYEGYRRLVSRFADPVAQKRFEAIYRAIRSVAVETIHPLDVQNIPFDARDVEPPFYLVVSSVDLDPQQRVSLRGENRKVGILVFRERGEWRMAVAPSRLQPGAPTSAPASQPTSQPDYPWDQYGDD